MNNVIQQDPKKARMRFVVLYLVSLVLVFVVLTAFFKKDGDPPIVYQPQNESEKSYLLLDTMLQSKMQQLDLAYAAYLKTDRQVESKEATDVFNEKKSLQQSLDSIESQAGALKDGPLKNAMSTVAAKFKRSFQLRDSVFFSLVPLHQTKTYTTTEPLTTTGTPNTEFEELKAMLVQKEQRIQELERSNPADVQEKDKMIASLQNQLKQKEATQNTGSGDSEWKQKYLSMKQAYDKSSANESSLKSAYKTVVDDNKRLLTQLQSLRKN